MYQKIYINVVIFADYTNVYCLCQYINRIIFNPLLAKLSFSNIKKLIFRGNYHMMQ